MNHAWDSDGSFVPEDTFFVDRKIEENDERETIKERREAKEAEWILEHDLGRAFLREHEFISLCVEAEGKVYEAIFFLGLADESSTIFFNEFNTSFDFIALEAKASPGAFPFTAAMNTDGGATKGNFAPNFHFKRELCSEGLLVKFDGAEVVGCPNGIFHFLNLHKVP